MRLPELRYEEDGLPGFRLAIELADLYRGSLGFDAPLLVANFVSSAPCVARPHVAGSLSLNRANRRPNQADLQDRLCRE